jgi:hypothetical protein
LGKKAKPSYGSNLGRLGNDNFSKSFLAVWPTQPLSSIQ